MSHMCVGKNTGGPPFNSSKSFGFLLLIYLAECGGAWTCAARVDTPIDPASVVKHVFGWAMRDPARGRGHSILTPSPQAVISIKKCPSRELQHRMHDAR